jgi:transcriptional regulator with XRE-family HTH domain
MNKHWTAESTKDFLYRIASDYIDQIQKRMDLVPISQSELARTLGVTEGRVSQILNKPGNLQLEKIIEYARAVGMKVAVVAYDDGDPDNRRGPISSEIFNICWEFAKRPTDFLTAPRPLPETKLFYFVPNTDYHGETRTVKISTEKTYRLEKETATA